MRGHAMTLALAASLILVGATRAEEQNPVTTGSISPAISSGEPGIANSGRTGFGFSPFLEEELVGELPPLRHRELRAPVPAHLREFRRLADP